MNEPQPHCPNERLNSIISVGLLIGLVMCIVAYVYLSALHKSSDGQLIQLGGTIGAGLIGFLARGVTQTGTGRGGPSSQVDAPNATTVNVSQPAAPNVPIPVPVVVEEAEEPKP